jgi:hypothetical protein
MDGRVRKGTSTPRRPVLNKRGREAPPTTRPFGSGRAVAPPTHSAPPASLSGRRGSFRRPMRRSGDHSGPLSWLSWVQGTRQGRRIVGEGLGGGFNRGLLGCILWKCPNGSSRGKPTNGAGRIRRPSRVRRSLLAPNRPWRTLTGPSGPPVVRIRINTCSTKFWTWYGPASIGTGSGSVSSSRSSASSRSSCSFGSG